MATAAFMTCSASKSLLLMFHIFCQLSQSVPWWWSKFSNCMSTFGNVPSLYVGQIPPLGVVGPLPLLPLADLPVLPPALLEQCSLLPLLQVVDRPAAVLAAPGRRPVLHCWLAAAAIL